MTPTTCSRRSVLTGAAGTACAALALTACGSEDSESDDSGSGGSESSANGSNGSEESNEPGGEPLASLDEVPVGEATAITTPGGDSGFVFRADETTVAAFSAVCTHSGGNLQSQGAELECPLHGSVFDPATGEVIEGPASEPLPAINVRIEGEQIVTA
jgi:nitrite reductase/ring-hydroxylating ferredoxin subunit